MEHSYTSLEEPRRRATFALWALPGVGAKGIEELGERIGGDWAGLLSGGLDGWEGPLAAAAQEMLRRYARLEDVALDFLERAHQARMGLCFPQDADYPPLLEGVRNAPPVLFFQGPGKPDGRPRLAMVGTRHPDESTKELAYKFARRLAERGVGVISGAAIGIDQLCHRGALEAGGETWAFAGSALDELDPSQAKLRPDVLAKGGTFFSELPPGVRADETTFPRRNRLISGAANAVLVVQAPEGSGALITAKEAKRQGRTVLALPADMRLKQSFGSNALIRDRGAELCMSVDQACAAAGLPAKYVAPPERSAQRDLSELSPGARSAYEALSRAPQPFENVLKTSGMPPARLTSALCELELMGLAIQLPGKLYGKV